MRSKDHCKADDRSWKTMLPVLPYEDVLTRELADGVSPLILAAIDRMVFGDRQHVCGRVDYRGAREDVMADPASQQIDHRFYVFRLIGADVINAVEFRLSYSCPKLARVGAIGIEPPHATGEVRRGLTAVQDRYVVACPAELSYQSEAVELRASHDEYFHSAPPEFNPAHCRRFQL